MARLTRRRRPPEAPSARPHFSPVEPSPPVAREFAQRLRHIPQRPKSLRSLRHLPFAARGLFDYLVEAPEWLARMRGRVQPYPAPFRRVHFQSWDGTRLSAWMGLHQRSDGRAHPLPREGIILVPGMFTTKDNVLFRSRATRIFREWGYHVFVMDLRGMGESSRVFNTAGWKESEDVDAAIDYFRAHAPIEKLHVYSESLGAVAAILAAARKAERGFRLVDGAVLAVSPYPDAKRMIRNLMRPAAALDATYVTQWFFGHLLRLGGKEYPNFEAYLKDAAKHYRISIEQLWRRSSARRAASKVNVPLLIIGSDDDPVVPAGDFARWQRQLRRRKNPVLVRLPWGSHCLYDILDPDWFWTMLRDFFDFYCVLPRRDTR